MKALILDSGAVTGLSRRGRRSAAALRKTVSHGSRVTVVPSIVLVECLSARQRTDVLVNRFLKQCQIVDGPSQKLAQRAAALRARAGRGSAVDAVVVAMAEPGGAILTGDLKDLQALSFHAEDVQVFTV